MLAQAESDKAVKVVVHKVSQAQLDKAAKDIGEIKKEDDLILHHDNLNSPKA